MPALAELQQTFLDGVLGGVDDKVRALVARGPITGEAALRVHRSTVFGALANALRLTFPTVDRLVGAGFFDQAAMAFAKESPPRRADLSFFGESFPNFLATYAPALRYLPDVARFDLAIDHAAASSDGWGAGEPVGDGRELQWKLSLHLEQLHYPVDLVRDALDASQVERLAEIVMAPAPRWFAFWRGQAGASVMQVSPALARLLATLQGGARVDTTKDRAADEDSPPAPEEVLRVPFLQFVRASEVQT